MSNETKHKTNGQIKAPQVAVIDGEGTNLGTMTRVQAMTLAEDAGLDLVEVSPNSNPPVCRLMDYGKYKYNLKKSQVKVKQQKVKGIRMGPNIAQHDLDVLLNRTREFLDRGDRVVVRMDFRGRELAHVEEGQKKMESFCLSLQTNGQLDGKIQRNGNSILMTLAPIKT